MTKKTKKLIYLALFFLFSCGIKTEDKTIKKSNNKLIRTIEKQYEFLWQNVKRYKGGERVFPRTTDGKGLSLVGPYDWTSGFYPGSLWYLIELTGEKQWETKAVTYTEELDSIQYWTGNHDVGFMIECSYGNGLKYKDSRNYEKVIVQTAKSLSQRFKPEAGVIILGSK